MECHSTTGEGDYLIKVVAPDMKAYDRFLQDKVFKTPGVANVRSSVVLREVKYETALPTCDPRSRESLPPGAGSTPGRPVRADRQSARAICSVAATLIQTIWRFRPCPKRPNPTRAR